jgi:fructokinase
MSEIAVIGEALVDVLHQEDAAHIVPGGSPMNVAVGLARLGRPTRFVSALGEDEHGALIRRHLSANSVSIDADKLERTSTAQATIGPDGSATYDFDIHWQLQEPWVSVQTPLLHIGSIAAVLEPGASTVASAAHNRPSSTLLSIDPNIRPGIIGDRAEALAALESLFATADIVKMSDEDSSWLYPDLSPDGVLDHMLDLGAELAVITHGATGARIATPCDRLSAQAPQVTVADTIGAGDSFMAGLIHSFLQESEPLTTLGREQLDRIARFASRCAAVTVSRVGANPPSISELALDSTPA